MWVNHMKDTCLCVYVWAIQYLVVSSYIATFPDWPSGIAPVLLSCQAPCWCSGSENGVSVLLNCSDGPNSGSVTTPIRCKTSDQKSAKSQLRVTNYKVLLMPKGDYRRTQRLVYNPSISCSCSSMPTSGLTAGRRQWDAGRPKLADYQQTTTCWAVALHTSIAQHMELVLFLWLVKNRNSQHRVNCIRVCHFPNMCLIRM